MLCFPHHRSHVKSSSDGKCHGFCEMIPCLPTALPWWLVTASKQNNKSDCFLYFEVWPYISVLTLSWVTRFPVFSHHSPLTPLKLLSFSGPLAMCEVSPRYPHHSRCLPFPFLSLKGTQRRQSVKSNISCFARTAKSSGTSIFHV